MAVSLTTNIDKIVFTSPNMVSPQATGLRSHVIPSESDLGTWLESGGTMTRIAMAQNIYDIPYNTGIDRPVFGISGTITSDTHYTENQTNNIYIDTEQTWALSFPRNVYVDDNSWLVAVSIDEYAFADDPTEEEAFLSNNFTSSGTLESTRNITINGCATFMDPDNYIFNTNTLYKYDPDTKYYSLIEECFYNVDYPVTMVGISGTLHMFYLDIDNLLIKNIQYDTVSGTWGINSSYGYHPSASTLSAINAVYIDNAIKVTFKYSENSIPSDLYIYNYNYILDSWSSTFINTCGKYNLDFNNALIEADSNYLYSLERSSKLLHKIDLTTKNDNQMVIRYETAEQSSAILNGNYLYTYIGNANKFTKIDITTETTYALSAPTLSESDSSLPNESTTLSTDGTYLYLGLNKGISWNNETSLYKYNISNNIWSKISAPTSGSVKFNGKMCKYSNTIYGSDDINLYIYNTIDNRWSMLSELPRQDAFDSVIAANSTHVYIVISECGYFWRYVLSTGNWEILQSVSLPAPLSYEGTCPGSLLIDDETIYLGLYYNHVLATRDTFFYKYDIEEETWTTYVAPKTSTTRSFYMFIYNEMENTTSYFSGPKGVTTDSSYFYITDTNNHKILKKLKSDLSHISQIGSLGSGNNRFNKPEDITNDDAHLYIVDTENNRISKRLKSDLSYVSKIGSYGTGNDNFDSPKGITSDGTHLYIADTENSRIIKRLKSDLSYVSKIGSYGTGYHYFNNPHSMVIDSLYIYLLSSSSSTLFKISKSTGNIVAKNSTNFDSPRGITCDDTYLYISDTQDHRVVKILKSNLSYNSAAGNYGSGNDNFRDPYGIACDSTYLYIADKSNSRIVIRLKSNLNYYSSFGSYGSGDDNFNNPRDITYDDTYFYIADSINNRIIKRLKSDYSYDSKIGSYGSGNDNFYRPGGITCTYSGLHLYIADTRNNRVVKRVKSDISYVSETNSYNSTNYNGPEGVALYEDYIYILDTVNNTFVTTSGSSFNYISHTNSAYDADLFNLPEKLTCDDTYLYISDTGNNRISKRLKSDLSYVSKIGSYGSGNDNFDSPKGITSDSTHLYITDSDNNKVVKRLKSDLSYVSKAETYDSISFNSPAGINTYGGSTLFILDTGHNTLVTLSGTDLSYLSKLASWSTSESVIHLAGDIAYTGNPVDTYTYRDFKCTDLVNNTWTETKAVAINAMETGKYICMYGQYCLNNIMYISFTTATNLGFNCSDPTCRQINLSTGTSTYWMINPTDKHYIITDPTNMYLYCTSVTNGILYKYDISTTGTTKLSIPRQSFVNYFTCTVSSGTYLLGKQEIKHDPALYKYNFYVYKDVAGSWDEYDVREYSSPSSSGVKLNTIQEYYELDGTVYMASFIRSTENTNVSEAIHKKYNIATKAFNTLDIPTLTTSITSSGSGNNLLLAVGNKIKTYDISTDSTETFQQGIAGNRSSAFSYIYKNGSQLRATGNQYFTPENGGKFITYEEPTGSGSWSIIDSKDISSTFYNTLDYAEKNNDLYIINTTEQMTLDLTTLGLETISNAPYSTIGTATSGGVIIYNDHYACMSYLYDDVSFTEIPSDVVKTHKSSNLLFTNETLYFTKNSNTNEISTINVVSGTRTIIYDDAVVGDTPFFCNINDDVYILQPEYNTLSTISGSYVNTIKTNLNINNHTTACSNGIGTIYFTAGENYYLFYKLLLSSGIVTQLPNLPEYNSNYSSIEYYDNNVYYITSNKLYLFDTQNETWDPPVTLQNVIYSKGIKIDSNYIYYCGNSSICKVNRNRPEVKPALLSPIPTRHHSSYCLDGTNIYLQYNTINLISECVAIIGDEKITTLSLNNVVHQYPSSVPYDIQLISNVEKEVEFSWSISSTAHVTHYRIYRTGTLDEDLIYVGKTTSLSFIDTLADRGQTYYYYVKTCNEYGSVPTFSNPFQVVVAGYSYKYSLSVTDWENRVKEINQLPLSNIYIWGDSNLGFNNTVRISITHAEAYSCYLTAWDDDSHSTTDNLLLTNECFRVSAVAFSTKEDAALVEPDIKAMFCKPEFNKVLKGNSSYYGKFNINYEALTDRFGAYIIFKPILINIPEEQLIKGLYLFKTVFHYQYT